MKNNLIPVLLVFVCFHLSVQAQTPKLKKAFNGKNLNAWVVPSNNSWWTVKNGILNAKSGVNKEGSILWTKKEYTDFVIQTDFRFGQGTVDSGIFIRNDKQQIQLGISGSMQRDMTASPYIPGKGYPVEAENIKKLLKPQAWNTIKVMAVAGLYKVWLNDTLVMTYNSDNYIPKGPIGLQLHPDRDMEIDFKDIKIGEIK
ncbi:DUF1080 domain-containing protein [Cellulophaga sp. F20128]|uniref:3-keto-disaccharide hydrolase n=1 Tax=Cellulophaga sp. F20128 TaxID=2926413 RepID=UPI001FF15F2E|nr:DUF1080 domain-containing protein [Cellulophaga sp. F20128]MCK0158027.1 DUF1080 domain-containing protein [Cellulophaga sp. F20128]